MTKKAVRQKWDLSKHNRQILFLRKRKAVEAINSKIKRKNDCEKIEQQKGFTIVELVIVIAVIAILATVPIPTFTSVISRARQSAAVQKVTGAYTEALAEVLADDGEITAGETATVMRSRFLSQLPEVKCPLVVLLMVIPVLIHLMAPNLHPCPRFDFKNCSLGLKIGR